MALFFHEVLLREKICTCPQAYQKEQWLFNPRSAHGASWVESYNRPASTISVTRHALATVGFQEGAIGLAVKNGIGLCKVSEHDDHQLHALEHLRGKTDDIVRFLQTVSPAYNGGALREATGIAPPTQHILDFVYDRFGKEVAAYLNTDDIRSPSEVADDAIRVAIINQIRQMDDNWIREYLNVERCALPLHVTPELQLRLYAMKIAVAKIAIEKSREG